MIADDRRRRLARPIPLALLWLAAGCGGQAPTVPLHPTTGRVLFQGQPLEGVQVTFRPITAGEGQAAPASVAKTDRDGKFQLVTALGPEGRTIEGAPAGEYAVALAPPGRSETADFFHKDAARATTSPIGNRYSNAQTSGLKATIKPGTNELAPFDLKESGGTSTPVPADSRGR